MRDQAEQQAAGQRDEMLATAEAKAEVAWQSAQPDLAQPAREPVEEHEGQQENEQPAHDQRPPGRPKGASPRGG